MKRMMIAGALVIALIVVFSGCGKAEFGVTDNQEKAMTITAKKAAKDDFFMSGTLTVGEGEQIVVTSSLEKGSVKMEFIGSPEEQSIDEVPEMDGEAAFTAEVSESDVQSEEVAPGDYMVRATVTEKATGTIQIDVTPVESE